MPRSTFLTLAAAIAAAVAAIALVAPGALLASKGVAPSAAAEIWIRELGVALLAIAIVAFRVRRLGDSAGMRAFLVGNAVLQVGLFPIELAAYRAGVITELAGIVPNSIVHVVLAIGFAVHAARVRVAAPAAT